MEIHEFVELNKKMGHRVVSTDNVSWLIRDDKTALSIPTLVDVTPSLSELEQVHKLGVRLISFKTQLANKNTFEYIFKGNSYNLDEFDSKIRNQIRKGLKSCVVKNAQLNDLVASGFKINQQTLARQQRSINYLVNKEEWQKYISVLSGYDDVVIKGAYVDGNLIAYAVFIKVLGKYYIYHPFMDHAFSASNPMNAILFDFINEVISADGEIEISYGLASYMEQKGLDKFKKGMLFTEVECTRIISIEPKIALLFNKIGLLIATILYNIRLIDREKFQKISYLVECRNFLKIYGSIMQ